MVNTNNISNIAIKIWFFEDTRKSDVGKTTKNAALNQKYFPRSPSLKNIKIDQEFMEKSEIMWIFLIL